MGRLDVGQSVAVKDRSPLAVEAIEGTDQCIRRAGTLCKAGGFTIVKVAKPQQDMRFDVPTIGMGTLEAMVAAGAKRVGRRSGPHDHHRPGGIRPIRQSAQARRRRALCAGPPVGRITDRAIADFAAPTSGSPSSRAGTLLRLFGSPSAPAC